MTSWFIKYRDRDSVVWRPSFLSTIRHSQGRVCVCVQGFSKGPDILFRVTSIWACMYNELLLNFFRSIAALEIILFFFYLIQKKEQKEKRLSTLTITLCIAPCVCVCVIIFCYFTTQRPWLPIGSGASVFPISHTQDLTAIVIQMYIFPLKRIVSVSIGPNMHEIFSCYRQLGDNIQSYPSCILIVGALFINETSKDMCV